VRTLTPLSLGLIFLACGTQATQNLNPQDGSTSGADASSSGADGSSADAGSSSDVGPSEDGGFVCMGLDEQACQAAIDSGKPCQKMECPGCNPPGALQWGACIPKDVWWDCPAVRCEAPCSTLSEDDCIAAGPRCAVDACHECANYIVYKGCRDPSAPAFMCPGLGCASTCSGIAECECTIAPDCHPVYADPGTCDCALAGCCIGFSRCEEGKNADCDQRDVMCKSTPPACGPNYTPSVSNQCWNDCVKPAECALAGP
jgi:hypothetical protein